MSLAFHGIALRGIIKYGIAKHGRALFALGSISRHDILKWGQTKTNVRVFKVKLNFHAQTALTPFGMGSPDCMPWNVADLVCFLKLCYLF